MCLGLCLVSRAYPFLGGQEQDFYHSYVPPLIIPRSLYGYGS